MKHALSHQSFAPKAVPMLAGLILLAAPARSATPAMELANSTPQETNQNQPTATPNLATPSPPGPTKQSQPSKQSSNQNVSDRDRVYIEDIYPEYCRSYFHRRDWVSMFEYQTGMYRCLYGTDHD